MARTSYQKLYFEGMAKHINAQFDNVHDKLDEIIEHQKETNGRVTKLEKDTVVFRWIHRHPVPTVIILAILTAGIIALGYLFGYEYLIKLIV